LISILFNIISIILAGVRKERVIEAFSPSKNIAFDSIFFSFHMISIQVSSNLMMLVEIAVDFSYFSLMISQLFDLIFLCVMFGNEQKIESKTEDKSKTDIIKAELLVFCLSSSMLSIGFRTMNFPLYFFS
jgi:hypothetical protein